MINSVEFTCIDCGALVSRDELPMSRRCQVCTFVMSAAQSSAEELELRRMLHVERRPPPADNDNDRPPDWWLGALLILAMLTIAGASAWLGWRLMGT